MHVVEGKKILQIVCLTSGMYLASASIGATGHLVKIKEVGPAQATEAAQNLQRNIEELQAAAQNTTELGRLK